MMSQTKKLSIAFYWHMHQPVYQLNYGGDYLMPWVRLHAVKDYLDMTLWAEKFEKIKLNFNIVPALIDAIIDYTNPDTHDIHSRLTITPVENLNNENKIFILNNFFDANYQNMILQSKEYHRLYKTIQKKGTQDPDVLSLDEYSDLMALFNLAWIDPQFKSDNPRLKKLVNKERGYTLEDRIEIIEIQRGIIKKIIPTMKKLLKNKKIEVTTSPYYHPILPILTDYKQIRKNNAPDDELAELKTEKDAKEQIETAINRIEEIFGYRPKGMWSSELCISDKTLDMLKKSGVEWTISDEGVLAGSINFEFLHDFKGYLEDPYHLLKTYKAKNSGINLIFRDSTIHNLISFGYSHHDPIAIAHDLYDRIKIIQSKVLSSPDKNHLLTIAMDCENCWENYIEDGNPFLETLYNLISQDKTIETVLLSDYIENKGDNKPIGKISQSSGANKNYKLWINEPVKDIAWTYLKHAKAALTEFEKRNPNNEASYFARKELHICEGSDWFWWYGEPNYSGRDTLFDFIFRTHLKNIYRYIGQESPEYLDEPLTSVSATNPSSYPISLITPAINGKDIISENDIWNNAGCIEIPDGPVLRESKIFEKIRFGNDENNLYLKFHLNKYIKNDSALRQRTYQMYIYLRKSGLQQDLAPIRLINKTANISPLSLEKFHNEIQISIRDDELRFMRIIKAGTGDVWIMENPKLITASYDEVLDVQIPFEILDIENGETLEFLFINANFGMTDFYIPNEMILSVTRPAPVLSK